MALVRFWQLTFISALICLTACAGAKRVKRAPPPLVGDPKNDENRFNEPGSNKLGGNIDAKPHIVGSDNDAKPHRQGSDFNAEPKHILPGNPEHAGAARVVEDRRKTNVKLADSPQCAADIKQFCPEKASSNNFLVLDCLQDDEKTDNNLSPECHHLLWQYKHNLTRDIRFDKASYEACAPELEKIPECIELPKGEGKIIPCLIENYNDVKSKSCSAFLNKMAGIVFSDYRFMDFFMRDCHEDIENHKCGRIDALDSEDDSPHSQGQTVKCLTDHKKELSKKCKRSMLRVAELQSDDFHLDRPLYYACKDDREAFCSNVVAGDGAVFKCLFDELGNKKLSDNCRARLEARQELIAEDVKADKTFYEACMEDIKKNHCSRGRMDPDGTTEEDLKRSHILLCLEQAQSDGAKVKSDCLQEMFELRSELMQDYKISPELVSACTKEIHHLCDGLEPGGNTIHCLMKAARSKEDGGDFSAQCKAQIRQLLHVANPGEDIRLDRPLQRACGDVVQQACSDRKAGQGEVITCLLENLDHEDMTDECEEHLLEIQYFAVRDFKLDFHLFKSCHKDAKNLCHSDGYNDPETMEPEQGPLIFSCLHRQMYSKRSAEQPSRACIHEIKRVMKERAMRINLMPEVEAVCLKDLSEFCSGDDEHTEVGGEMECLQLNMEDLSEECRVVVSNFTMEEVEDIEMDKILMKSCTPMIKKFCSDLLDSDAMPNEVLDCLIEHKRRRDMDEKCAAGIEHHQLISLQDFRFNRKFRQACQEAVAKLCRNKRTKYEVVACLSEHVRNDTLRDMPQRIDAQCQRQLKVEMLQRGESVNLDKKLKSECKDDILRFCENVKAGEGEITECLRKHRNKLSPACHAVLFQRAKEEVMFGDYSVHHACKKMIENRCGQYKEEADIWKCLKAHRNDEDFDDKCRRVILRRQVEQSKDFRLNPNLQKSCHQDIPKFCAQVYDGVSKDKEMEGVVIDCLKKQLALKPKSLSKECEHEIKSRVKSAALDINQNPVLIKACKDDIKHFCREEITNIQHMEVDAMGDEGYQVYGDGSVIECLKKNFKMLKAFGCKKEVAYMIAESRVDVHVDPLLHTTCTQDLMSLCKTVQQGQGRQMSCLLSYLETDPDSLTRDCKNMLQRRKDLWEYAAQVAPAESFSELYDQMSASPSRNYFFAIVFTVVGIIFIFGLTCGRVTKRVRAELKNK